MNWLNTFERRFGKYAIPELTWKLLGLQLCVFVLGIFYPEFYSTLALDPQRVLNGEVWRLFTFFLIPPAVGLQGVIWLFFYAYCFWLIGASLEREWGYFRYNVFWLIGILGTAFVAFFTPRAFVSDVYYVQLSLFLAFATLFPNFTFYLFLILPVKVKYLGFLSAAALLAMLVAGDASARLGIVVALGNYLLFFGPAFLQEARIRHQNRGRCEKFKASQKKMESSQAFHTCAVCGKTDTSHPSLEFRVGSDGKDYCREHLSK